MIEAKVKDGEIVEMTATGGIVDLCADVCCLIAAVHDSMRNQSAEIADAFRYCVTQAASRPDSPMWHMQLGGDVESLTILLPIKKEGGER